MKLMLVNQAKERIPQAWLERWLKDLARSMSTHGFKGLARKELVIVFVGKTEIRRLNRLYRHMDYATDILSFEPADQAALGELVICLPVIKSQSLKAGHSLREELGLMVVHGVLHLLGFDHMKVKDEAKMFALQNKIFERLAKLHFPLR